MAKMLIPKPFIVVNIKDSDRVLLDIIKLCLPWGREWGVRITNGMSHGLGKNPYKFGDRKSTAWMFTKAQLIDVQTSAK